MAFFLFLLGLSLLYFGADFLVSGSSRVAVALGIQPIIVGMTVVAFATSMPEFMVSFSAAVRESSDIAVGNIIGSNIANIGLILGSSAVFFSIPVSRATLTREIPFMVFTFGLLYFFCWDGNLGSGDGLVLFSCLIIFLVYCIISVRRHSALRLPQGMEAVPEGVRMGDFVRIGGGIIGLGAGAEMMVGSAITMARALGVTELVIGMSVVALGTSLPELAASLVSAWKGDTQISIGNVIGSNIFNVLFVLGLCPMIHPIKVDPATLGFEFPIMLLFSILLFPLILPGFSITRSRGSLLLAGYLLFIWILFR